MLAHFAYVGGISARHNYDRSKKIVSVSFSIPSLIALNDLSILLNSYFVRFGNCRLFPFLQTIVSHFALGRC